MTNIKVSPRPATEDDLEQVCAIEKASIRPPWNRASFASEIDKKYTDFWVLTDDETDNTVLGYIVFAMPAEQAHIQTIAIEAKKRKHGFAKLLLRAVISYVQRKKGESIILEVRVSNQAAVNLYQSLGFVIIHRVKKFYPDGEDAFALLYSLTQQKLSGDPESDYEIDPNESPADRSQKNFN